MGEDKNITVAGLCPGSLTPSVQALKAILDAHVLAGGRRLLDRFPDHEAERIPISSPLGKCLEDIRAARDKGRVVVLADGDPLFFGIARTLIKYLGSESVRVIPAVSTVQEAAARLNIPWAGAEVVSLHGRADQTPLFSALASGRDVFVFTDGDNTPAAIARAMLDRGADCFRATVCQDLGTDEEQVQSMDLGRMAETDFSALNLVVLRPMGEPVITAHLGMADNDFMHEAGLITKAPVRAAGLAALALRQEGVLWDVGAGSGSMAVEAASIMRRGAVIAVEQDQDRVSMIRENIRRTHTWQVEVIQGRAPEALETLPDPDRVFLGGGLSGEDSREVLARCWEPLAPGGVLVAHAILLDTVTATLDFFKSMPIVPQLTQLAASRSEPLAGSLRLRADNPVFIIRAVKPEEAVKP